MPKVVQAVVESFVPFAALDLILIPVSPVKAPNGMFTCDVIIALAVEVIQSCVHSAGSKTPLWL